jgi:SAM-dependent methyltransferase
MLRSPLRALARAYFRWELKERDGTQKFRRTNERPVEYACTFRWLNDLQPRSVLDVGTGESALPAMLRTCGFMVTAIDSVDDYWARGLFNRHWYVLNDDVRRSSLPAARFDSITCVSVLEHISDPILAMRGIHRLLKPGGALVLTTPFGAVGHPNVYTLDGSYSGQTRYSCRQSMPDDLADWLSIGFRLESAEYWQFFEDSEYWSCGPLLRPPRQTESPVHLGCFLLVKEGTFES